MTKTIAAAAAAFFAIAAMIGSGAEAGFNMRLAAPSGFSALQKAGCGGGGYFRSYRKSYRSAHRSVKRKIQIARKPAAEVSVAKAEPKVEPKVEPKIEPETKTETAPVVSENSSISTANAKTAEAKPVEANPVETAKPEKVAAAKEIGCKKFFPAVGMTLTVSCE